MSAERGVDPSLRKEDVARALNLMQQLEAGLHVRLRGGRAQRVMEAAKAVEHPGLVLSVGDVAQRLKEAIAFSRICGQGGEDELQPRLAVGIPGSLDLLFDNRPP